MERLSIGRMAEANRVSVQALRLYDRLGLLIPVERNENGYRYYDIKQSARLDLIQSLQLLGMSLHQIKDHLNRHDGAGWEEGLKLQLTKIGRQMARLAISRRSVERALSNCRRYAAAPPDGTIFVEYMAERRIYCYDSGVNFYDYGLEMYECILRELKRHISLAELPPACFCNVGTILRQARLEKGEFISTEVFVFADDDFACGTGVETLPARTWLCISCDGFHKERAYAERLMRAVTEQGYSIGGDYVCEVVMDLPGANADERSMWIKLQIPVNFPGDA